MKARRTQAHRAIASRSVPIAWSSSVNSCPAGGKKNWH